MNDEKMLAVLGEIRDAQLRFNEDYRRLAGEAAAIQKQSFELQQGAVAQQKVAVEAQARHLRLYRRVLAVSAVVIIAVVALLVSLSALR